MQALSEKEYGRLSNDEAPQGGLFVSRHNSSSPWLWGALKVIFSHEQARI